MAARVLLELADSKIKKIGRHFRGFLEADNLLVPLFLLGLEGHVGDYGEIASGPYCEFEVCLVSRMVHAWQESAGVCGFEVC